MTNNLIGKTVFGIDGPGQSACAELAGSVGAIVREDNNRWGSFWVVQWENGTEETFSKHTVKPTTEQRGIGVYYEA